MISFFVMDVDGTLTDGKIYMSPSGEIMKAFSIKDGCGIHDLLLPTGCIPMILTGRKNEIVNRRCEEIGITQIYQGVQNKVNQLCNIVGDNLETVAYIGDDINDLACMMKVLEAGGVVGCPADAVDAVKGIASFVASNKGGEGAVRDFIEWLIENKLLGV